MSAISSSDIGEPTRSNELRKLGFQPETLVAHQKPRFTIEDIKAALFSTTYSNPKTLTVILPKGHTVQVAITKAEPHYNVNGLKLEADENSPATCYEYPDWYMEGWVVDGIATATAQGLRVRMFVYAHGDDSPEPDDMYAQVIPKYSYSEGEIFSVFIPDN
ncbi:hypothetical protein ACU639_17785 [Streptomyces cynarae]|uniref:hypothetical protein n=1 Tax=Streptomyces cynarae TaxID=2981134 RepID=UPI00406D0B32